MDLISRQMAIDASRNKTVSTNPDEFYAHDKFIKFQNNPEIVSYGRWEWSNGFNTALVSEEIMLKKLPSAQPEQLTDDDFETIRIHLNAYKEKLCNQKRWKEAEEYQRIIDRFVAFASAQKRGEWLELTDTNHTYVCSVCGRMLVNITDGKNTVTKNYPFCHCGADMRGGKNEL